MTGIKVLPKTDDRVRYINPERNPDRIKYGTLGTVVMHGEIDHHVEVIWDIIGRKTITHVNDLELVQPETVIDPEPKTSSIGETSITAPSEPAKTVDTEPSGVIQPTEEQLTPPSDGTTNNVSDSASTSSDGSAGGTD